MNSTLLVLLIGCGFLQQAIADLPLKLSDEVEPKNPAKYYPSSPEYFGPLPKFGGGGGSLGLPDYFICKKTILNSYEPVDLVYSTNPANHYGLRRSDRLAKRFQNNLPNLMYDTYKMNNYQDELLPKPTRKSDDPKIFRNLFLGSRG